MFTRGSNWKGCDSLEVRRIYPKVKEILEMAEYFTIGCNATKGLMVLRDAPNVQWYEVLIHGLREAFFTCSIYQQRVMSTCHQTIMIDEVYPQEGQLRLDIFKQLDNYRLSRAAVSGY